MGSGSTIEEIPSMDGANADGPYKAGPDLKTAPVMTFNSSKHLKKPYLPRSHTQTDPKTFLALRQRKIRSSV
jgi:hypothetical protein